MAPILKIDPVAPAPEAAEALQRVLVWLRAGGVVAMPTETVYGLAANATNPAAVRQVFEIKGRDATQALPVIVRDLEQAAGLAGALPPLFFKLAAEFWPGPLTLIVPAAPGVPPGLTAGRGTIAMRQAATPWLRALLAHTGFPVTATSANRSGAPVCTSAAAVATQLGDRLAGIVDGGPSAGALPSTLVDLSGAAPRLLRAGALPVEALAHFW